MKQIRLVPKRVPRANGRRSAGHDHGRPARRGLGSGKIEYPKGSAEHCIFIWLGGGAAHIDTFDPKQRGWQEGCGLGLAPIATAMPGVQVCEHLKRTAPCWIDSLVRTVHHEVIDEHAAAVNRLHTGRPTSGTVVYPSIGSVVAHKEKPPPRDPSLRRDGVPQCDTGSGFFGRQIRICLPDRYRSRAERLEPADYITDARQQRRECCWPDAQRYLERNPGDRFCRTTTQRGRSV